MELKDLCVSLEMAKRLHKAGIEIDTLYEWLEQYLGGEFIWSKLVEKQYAQSMYGFTYRHYPAPTAEELWYILPQFIEVGLEVYYLCMEGGLAKGTTIVKYISLLPQTLIQFSGESVSEVLCDLALWL
jgi:hypothetical protein